MVRSREWDTDSKAINKVASINKTVYGCVEKFAGGRMFNVCRVYKCKYANVHQTLHFNLTDENMNVIIY